MPHLKISLGCNCAVQQRGTQISLGRNAPHFTWEVLTLHWDVMLRILSDRSNISLKWNGMCSPY